MKRLFDILVSFILLVLLSPLMLLLTLLVACTSKGGPFFLGPRIGKNGRVFNIIKFRSMKVNSEGNGTWNISGKDKRVTKVGLFLRKTKLDELPQLFNVFIGQMSFVGPRPELKVYVDMYSRKEEPILDNKPGLTDWASIVNSNQIKSFTESNDPDYFYLHFIRPLKLELQLYYRYHHNFFSDILCLICTAFKVLHINILPKKIKQIVSKYEADLEYKQKIRKIVEHTKLKKTELNIPRIGFGGCPMGGYGWGKTNDNDFIDAVRFSLDVGLNYFDTADTYGLGKSEEILGEALKGRRSEAIIATKFGVRRSAEGKTFYDNSPEWIRQALEESLKRLQTDYIDVYFVHYFDGKTPLEDIFSTLQQLKNEGKIRCFGISNVYKEQLKDFYKYKDVISCSQNEYSMATRKNEETINLLSKDLNITPMTWGSLGQGILTGTITKDTVFGSDDRRSRPEYVNFHGEKFLHNLMVVDEIKKMMPKYKKSCASIALRYVLDKFPDSVCLVGIKTIDELKLNTEVFGWSLDKDDFKKLDEISKWND